MDLMSLLSTRTADLGLGCSVSGRFWNDWREAGTSKLSCRIAVSFSHARRNVHHVSTASKVVSSTEQLKKLKGSIIALCASVLYFVQPPEGLAIVEEQQYLDPGVPVLDLARIVPAGQEAELIQQLRSLEEQSGWKLRVLTRNGPKQGPSGEEIKKAWSYDKKTGIILCDPTSPNILQFQVGDAVGALLTRGFFIELQSRYGNQFYVRDEGEASAILESTKAMSTCLSSGKVCQVVPGIPENQYQLTLITSIIGGFVFGFSTTIQPQGFVRRKFIWPLLFAPLWGTLAISFGIGPIVTRTQDKLPLLQNALAFFIAAGIFRLSPLFKPGAVNLDIISKEGQKKRDAENKE